jgi:HSP20 family protein
MAKKSFFSRLMGSDIVDEGRETQVTRFSFDAEEETETAAAPRFYEEEEPAYDFGQTETEPMDQMETEQNDWATEGEYEGQLPVDVYQTKDDVIIQSMIPGVEAADIDITIANDKVTIEGERKKQNAIRLEDYFYQECYWGSFSRSVVLPVDVDVDNVEAKMNNGILTVILPKAAKAKVRKVQITS